MSLEENEEKLYKLLNKYNVHHYQREEFLGIINTIFIHDEFQKRMSVEYLHHSDITLGEHIIEDAILAFKIAKLKSNMGMKISNDLVVKIAMLHDLYTKPWQNNDEIKSKNFFNKHGFTHPIESVINANIWFPQYFCSIDDAMILTDGIVHHMFPLPVASFKYSETNDLELENFDLLEKVSDINVEILIECTNRNKVFNLSFCPSIYEEGKIVSLADKKVSINQIKNIYSASALLTGKNRSLKK